MGLTTSSNCPCCSNERDFSSTNQAVAMAERSVTKLLAVFKALDHEHGFSKGYSVDDVIGYVRENLHATGDVKSQVTTALNNALSQGLIRRRYHRYM
jgi:hypothetical protein